MARTERKSSSGPSAEPAAQTPVVEALLEAGRQLADRVDMLRFSKPVSHVYNPLRYAWRPYEAYLRKYATNRKQVVFLGMNPAPFGMVQTGIPFGEVRAVVDWLGIREVVETPSRQHPSRPVQGFECPRSEVSGQRLWGFFAQQFAPPQDFFREHLVMNYCPLAFLEESGRNRTPDKLVPAERKRLFEACDEHLSTTLAVLQPEWLVCVGGFACARGREVVEGLAGAIRICQILHPSPASPAANRGWGEAVLRQLLEHGILKQPR